MPKPKLSSYLCHIRCGYVYPPFKNSIANARSPYRAPKPWRLWVEKWVWSLSPGGDKQTLVCLGWPTWIREWIGDFLGGFPAQQMADSCIFVAAQAWRSLEGWIVCLICWGGSKGEIGRAGAGNGPLLYEEPALRRPNMGVVLAESFLNLTFEHSQHQQNYLDAVVLADMIAEFICFEPEICICNGNIYWNLRENLYL